MSLDSDSKRRLKSAITTMSTQCLVHLRDHLRTEALGNAELALATTDIRFDTIPRVALEEVRKAYIRILDDPVALEALKKELTA